MNGKAWERCIQESCDKRMIFCKRLNDGTANWNRGNTQVRFQKPNECDFIIFSEGKLALVEAKVHKGKSIPLDCIRPSQIKGLTERAMFKGVICGLLILFSDLEEAYFLTIQEYLRFVRTNERKSIPFSYCRENGAKINITKKIKNYDIKIDDILLN